MTGTIENGPWKFAQASTEGPASPSFHCAMTE